MNQIPYINIGEIVHDHYGEYKTVYSGNISQEDIDKKILRDTKVGLSENDNMIIDFGLCDNFPYFWICYNCKDSEDNVSVGRSHAIYTTCSLESLYSFESLLRFPFVNSVESKRIVCGEYVLSENKYLDYQNISNERTKIDNELLVSIISYCLKKKKTGFKNFLYIIVSDTVAEYQRYCLSIISTIFSAIPIGLRKQFKIATNAAEENEGMYHILFCRESVFNEKKRKGDYIYLENSQIPDFMQKVGTTTSLEELIRRCVVYPQGTRNSNIDDCYFNMEQKKKGIADIRERDYSDYYEILKLRCVEITPVILKEYDDKLSQNLSAEQMDMLKKQIISTFSNISVLEDNINKTDMDGVQNSFDGIVKLLSTYAHVIQYLQKCEVFFTDEYLQDKMRDIKEYFCSSFSVDDRKTLVAQQLDLEKAWKIELRNNKERFEQFFWTDAIAHYIEQCDVDIANLEEQYKNECLLTWRSEISSSFNAENIRQYCQKVKNNYPGELSVFCDRVMKDLAQNSTEYEGEFVSVINEILKESPDIKVSPELYEVCEDEFKRDFQIDVSKSKIEKSVNWIQERFGEKNKRRFIYSMYELIESLFEQGLNGKGCCAKLGNEDLLGIVTQVESYGNEIAEVFKLRSNVNRLIQRNLEYEVKVLSQADDLSENRLALLWISMEKYLSKDESALNSVKSLMINTLFEYMKSYSERIDADPSSREFIINLVWGFIATKDGITKEIQEWYDEWTNEDKRKRQKLRIEKHTNSFLNYLYACRYDADAVEAIGKKELRNKVFNCYLNEKENVMRPGYSMTSFLNAIIFIENVPIEDVLGKSNQNFNSNASLYREEFRFFCEKRTIPIVISKKSDVAAIVNEIRCISYLAREDDNFVFLKYYDKNGEHIINTRCEKILNVLNDVISLKNNYVIKPKKEYFWSVETEDCRDIWKFLIDGKVIKEADFCNLKNLVSDEQSREMNDVFRHFDTKKRKEKLKVKGFIAGIVFLSLLLFGLVFSAGYKVASLKVERKSGGVEKWETSIIDSVSEGDVTSEVDSTSEIHSNDRDDVESVSNAEEPSKAPENSSGESGGNLDGVANGGDLEITRYGKIQDGGKAVRIRAGIGTDTVVFAYASSSDDLTLILCDSVFIANDGMEWQKVRFTAEYIDNEGNIVPEGTEAYVAAKYIMPIE